MQLLQISLFFHLAICCSNIYAVSVLDKSRVLIVSLNATTLSSEDKTQNEKQSVSKAITLNLPKGFKPQPSPLNPLLYPFVTEEASAVDVAAAAAISATTSGWKPIVNEITSTQQSTTYIPLLQDRVSITAAESQQPNEGGPIFESVVYGTWKTDPPLQPEKIFDSLHKMINGQHGSNIETLGQIDEATKYSNSQESIDGRRSQPWLLKEPDEGEDFKKQPIKKYGRHKIPPHEPDNFDFDRSKTTGYGSILEVINVNISDPKLLDIAKQINDSVEMLIMPNKEKPTRRVTNWTPIGPTIAATIRKEQQQQPKLWPTDFDQTTAIPLTAEKSNYNFVGDSSEPPQALSGLNIPESLLPQIPVNITKMGVPYENQNSAEEPTICVPLTVRETINTTEILDVERVYCFPLPVPEIDVRNDVTMDGKINTLSNSETINSSSLEAAHCKCLFILMTALLLQLFII